MAKQHKKKRVGAPEKERKTKQLTIGTWDNEKLRKYVKAQMLHCSNEAERKIRKGVEL